MGPLQKEGEDKLESVIFSTVLNVHVLLVLQLMIIQTYPQSQRISMIVLHHEDIKR